MKFADDLEAFLRAEVNLDQKRLDLLQSRVDDVETFASADATFRDMFIDLIPAGSWAHKTIIRPVGPNDEFDADVLLYVEEQPEWDPKDYIQKLWTAFRNSSTDRELVTRKTRCVRVNYKGDFHIDVVPYMERFGSNYITNRLEPESTGSFELSNPERFTAWIDERQRITGGRFIKVVRLMKYLRDFKNTFQCKSIILTTLLGNQVFASEEVADPSPYADLPTSLVTLMEKLAASLPATMPPVMDPGETGDNFSERYKESWNYTNFREQISRYADMVRAAYDEPDRDKSIALWRDIFGDSFKTGVLAKAADVATLSASSPWTGERFIDKDLGFKIKLDPRYQVRISGRVTGLRTGQVYRRRGFREYELSREGNRVRKNRNIKFLATTNAPAPYDVYWKVRNGGKEAADAGQLRGEIKRSEGHTKNEPTAFAGYHYVEVYIVKDGVVVARDRQGVVVTAR
jgi:hypothetical protein